MRSVWLSILAMAGWGASFYTPRPQNDFDSVIGQGEVKFYLTSNPAIEPGKAGLSISSLAFGFTRDFYDSFVEYQRRLLREFDRMAGEYGFRVVDASRTIRRVAADLRRAVARVIESGEAAEAANEKPKAPASAAD